MQVSEPDQAYLFAEIWLCVKIKDPPRFLGSFGKVSQPHGVFSLIKVPSSDNSLRLVACSTQPPALAQFW